MTRRIVKRSTAPPVWSSEILQLLDREVTEIDGRKVGMREAEIELLYRRSLASDLKASLELQRIRDANRSETWTRFGVLVVPEKIPPERWEALAAQQQAPNRNKSYGVEES